MNKILLYIKVAGKSLVLCGLCSASLCFSDEYRQENMVVLHALPSFEGTALNRLRDFMTANTQSITVSGDHLSENYESLALALESLHAKYPRREDVYARIAFVECPTDESSHFSLDRENRIVVINTTALKVQDYEIYLRRLERLAMKGLADLMGVQASMAPRCATYVYKDLNELDGMSRNYSPPVQAQFEHLAEQKGLYLKKPESKLPGEARE